MNPADTRGQTDVLLGAITKEKASFAHLAAAAQACRDADAKRLYNRLALDGLEHLLTLVARMGSLADDWLARLDLTLPAPNLPDPLPVSEDAILRSTMQEEVRPQNRCSRLSPGVDREELLALLESLRVEEEEHCARLRAMLAGLEAEDHPVMATRLATWRQTLRRINPVVHLH